MTDPTNLTASEEPTSEVSEERREFERHFDAVTEESATTAFSPEQ